MPAKTISLEEAYGTPKQGFPELVPEKRAAPNKASAESFLPGTSDDGLLPKDSGILQILTSAAEQYEVPLEYSLALAHQESTYDPSVENEIGAKGLFQFMDATSSALGIDPFDPTQASDAAMKEFAQQARTKGIDWAIAHHFAGPNTELHGPKTKEYVQTVREKAERIARLLGKDRADDALIGQVMAEDENPQTIKPRKAGDVISLEEAYGPVGGATATATTVPGVLNEDFQRGFQQGVVDPIVKTGKRVFESITDRLKAEIPGLRSPEEREQAAQDKARGIGELARATFPDGTVATVSQEPSIDRELRWRQAIIANPRVAEDLPADLEHLRDAAVREGFIMNLKSPIASILEDSLPASVVSIYANLPETARKKWDKATQIIQQENIVANPDKFPAVSVAAAQRAIDAREAKQDPTVREQWNALKESAGEDPGKFGAQLVNALWADPEMLLAPVGFGAKPIQSARVLATGAQTQSKVIKLADRVLDGSALGATLNVGITAADQLAHSTHLNMEELKFSAAAGALLSGPLAGIFSRGARAKIRSLDDAKLKGDYEQILRDQAAYDVEIERAVNDEFGPEVTSEVKTRINDMLGITSRTDRRKWIAQRRKEVRESFQNEAEFADYIAFKAEERMARAEQLKSERAASEAATAKQAAGAEGTAAEIPSTPAASGPSPGEVFRVLRKPGHLRTAEDMIILRSVPKGQRGDVDPKILARLAATGGFATIAYGVAPEDKKVSTAFLAGLAGLAIPGGGRVLSRMRQSGAVSVDGTIPGLAELVKEGKLKADIEPTAARAAEAENLARARQGDQQAFKKIYEDNFERIARYVRTYLRDAGPKLGIDAEDVAQDVFVQFFNGLDNFKGDSAIYTYLQAIAKNKALNEVQRSKTQRGGGEYKTTSLYNAGDDAGPGDAAAGHITEGEKGLLRSEAESAAADFESPEFNAMYGEAQERLLRAVKKLPERQQAVFLLNRVEGMIAREIGEKLRMPLNTVLSDLKRANDIVLDAVGREFDAAKIPPVATSADTVIPVKRGRGRPRKNQQGSVDPKTLMKVGGVGALGLGAYTFLETENKRLAATIAAIGGIALLSRGRTGDTLARGLVGTIDHGLGAVSTRIMNISRPIWWRTMEHYRKVLRDTHKYMKDVDPFLVTLEHLPKTQKDFVIRAILTGNAGVTSRLLKAVDNPELNAGWAQTRTVLDSIGDQLVHLKRFKHKDIEYFPRIVTDYPGLLKALGKSNGDYLNSIVDAANRDSIRARGTELTQLERSLVINKALMTEPKLGGQPGFAKDRSVKEITPELQKFYATPTESLHSYIRSAVEDIERAKFFGKDLEVVTKDGKEYTNVDKSVGKLVDELLRAGKIDEKQAMDLSSMLKSLFLNGEKQANEIIQKAKNLSYAGLLGNALSATTQLGDVVIQTYIQGLRPTLAAVARSATGRKHVSMKEFGLADHLAEEFVTTEGTAKFLRRAFKVGGFTTVDSFGKNVALNGAINKFGRWSKSESGLLKLQEKYGDVLQPQEFQELVKALQKGEVNDLVRAVAFAELSRTQPITRLELPQAYLDNPNGRLLYQFKTFMLKQLDVIRRDAIGEMKKGNVGRGIKNLAMFATVLGISGASTDRIKSWLKGAVSSVVFGRDMEVDPFELSDIPMNMLKTFGMSEYVLDHMFGVSKEEAERQRMEGDPTARKIKPEPIQTAAGVITPPFKMMDDIITADPQALRYIPFVGPFLYEEYKRRKAEELN